MREPKLLHVDAPAVVAREAGLRLWKWPSIQSQSRNDAAIPETKSQTRVYDLCQKRDFLRTYHVIVWVFGHKWARGGRAGITSLKPHPSVCANSYIRLNRLCGVAFSNQTRRFPQPRARTTALRSAPDPASARADHFGRSSGTNGHRARGPRRLSDERTHQISADLLSRGWAPAFFRSAI